MMKTYIITLKQPYGTVTIQAEKVNDLTILGESNLNWFIFTGEDGQEVGRYRQDVVAYWTVEETTAVKPLTGDSVLERLWDNSEDSIYDNIPLPTKTAPPFVARPLYPEGVTPFELIQEEDYSGYVYNDVLGSLNYYQAKDLQEWMHGQTMGLHQTPDSLQTIIYTWDFERWLLGLPVID